MRDILTRICNFPYDLALSMYYKKREFEKGYLVCDLSAWLIPIDFSAGPNPNPLSMGKWNQQRTSELGFFATPDKNSVPRHGMLDPKKKKKTFVLVQDQKKTFFVFFFFLRVTRTHTDTSQHKYTHTHIYLPISTNRRTACRTKLPIPNLLPWEVGWNAWIGKTKSYQSTKGKKK